MLYLTVKSSNVYLLLILLWNIGCVASDASTLYADCPLSQNKKSNYVLTSEKNNTGHWISQIQLQHVHDTTPIYPYEVQLLHNTPNCDERGRKFTRITETISEPPFPKSPGPDYVYFPGLGYYKLNLKHEKWEAAKEACEEEGAHLAIINSVDEAKALAKLFAHHIPMNTRNPDDQAYIGVHDSEYEGDFVTIFGKPLKDTGFNVWAQGEPSNSGDGENCVTLRRNGRMNDFFCFSKLTFFCEKEAHYSK